MRMMLKYFWLAAIVVVFVNTCVLWWRARRETSAQPELADGYKKLISGYFVFFNIPWVVMGIGMTIGGVPTVLHYFRPRDGNPHVIAWHGTVVLLWIVGSTWMFRGGAEFLVRHPGVMSTKSSTPSQLKRGLVFPLMGGIAALLAMWLLDFPAPHAGGR